MNRCRYFSDIECEGTTNCGASNPIDVSSQPIDLGFSVTLTDAVRRELESNHARYTALQTALTSFFRALTPELSRSSAHAEIFWRAEAPDERGQRPFRCYLRYEGQEGFLNCFQRVLRVRLLEYAEQCDELSRLWERLNTTGRPAVAITYESATRPPITGAEPFNIHQRFFADTLKKHLNSGRRLDGIQIDFGSGVVATLPNLSPIRREHHTERTCNRESVVLRRCMQMAPYTREDTYRLTVRHNDTVVRPMETTLSIPIPVFDNSTLGRRRHRDARVGLFDQLFISLRGYWRTKALCFPNTNITGISVTEIIDVEGRAPFR